MTTMPYPTVETDLHVPITGQVLSTHRTSRGTSTYVRCSCGGFVVMAVDGYGTWREMGHAGRSGGDSPRA